MMPMLVMLVWITLNFLLLEFVNEVDYIAAYEEKVLEVDYAVRCRVVNQSSV